MLFGEGPTACPFVALESDRDRRSDEPDHRHRCYAEPEPAPRAIAHQRTYCLTAAFPTCPIFQDWAVRAAAMPVPLRPGRAPVDQEPQPGPQPLWAAIPAGGEPIEMSPEPAKPAERPPQPAQTDRVPSLSSAPERAEREEAPLPAFLAGRADMEPPAEDRIKSQRSYQDELHRREDLVPSWQRQPLYRTYPSLRSRVGFGDSGDLIGKITTLLAIGVILSLAVVAIILAPSFLGGGSPGPTRPAVAATSSPRQATPRPSPAPTAAPSPQQYTVRAGDTLFSIARSNGLTVDQLLAANPDIQNADLVQIGQVIVIPDDDFGLFSPAHTPAPANR
jgi:hypothetical protein